MDDKASFRTYLPEEISGLTHSELEMIARCYQVTYNHFWGENWTLESALEEVTKSLEVNPARMPLLTLLKTKEKVFGFAWVILTAAEFLRSDDMPFGLDEEQKKQGISTARYWLDLAKENKVIIFREIGLLPDHQLANGEHAASHLSLPLAYEALKRGYKVLFYWSNPHNASFKQGLGFGWHPVHFFVDADRVLLKGGVKKLVYFLEGVLKRDRNIIREMAANRKMYFET